MTRTAAQTFWLLAAVIALPLGAEQRVDLALVGGSWVVSSLPPVLGEAEVERHLSSGLTVSFVLQGAGRGLPPAAAARIDIRYELWDERYLVTVVDGLGTIESSEHESAAALASWWAELAVAVLGPDRGRAPPETSRMRLDLIPFSHDELVDARRWLSESLGRGLGETRPGSDTAVARAVGALIATSLRRRASRTWALEARLVRHQDNP